MAVTRASKRRRKNCQTQKLRREPNEEDDEKQLKIVAGYDTAGVPVIGGSYDEFKSNKSPVVIFAHGTGAPSSSDWMISCMVAWGKDVDASAIVCLGYPLKGSKQGLCPLEKLNAVRKKIKPVSDLHVIEGGDHSFKVGKKHLQLSGTTQDEVEDQALQAIQTFVGYLSVEKQIKSIPAVD